MIGPAVTYGIVLGLVIMLYAIPVQYNLDYPDTLVPEAGQITDNQNKPHLDPSTLLINMVVCACARDKQACLHSNSCNAHLRDTPISELLKRKLPSRIMEGRIIEVLLYLYFTDQYKLGEYILTSSRIMGMPVAIGS